MAQQDNSKKLDFVLKDPPVQPRQIKKVAVIGAGAMGSGIAAHLANAGVEVYMIDKNPATPKAALERMLKATPATDALNAGFMSPDNVKLIKTGNTDENLADAVKDADWIIEAIIEDLGLKRKLFAEVDKYRKPGSIVSSNTSTLPLKDLVEGRSEAFKKDFIITHFFNPPRFMRLLELVSGAETNPEVTAVMREFGDVRLGKQVVECKDTPGFIANRIGAYFLFRAIIEALDKKIPIEDVDAVLSKPMGFPKEGVFGLLDMVGIGIVPHVNESLRKNLPQTDGFHKIFRSPRLIDTMLANSHWGRNAPAGGFYRMKRGADGSRIKQVIDMKKASDMFENGEWDKAFGKDNGKNPEVMAGLYRDVKETKLKCVAEGRKGPWAVFETGEPASELAWNVMRDTLLYVASLVPDVTDDITKIDAAMREGYNWKHGPFELLDKIGVEWFADKVKQDGLDLPPALELAKDGPFYRREKGVAQRMTFDFAAQKTDYTAVDTPEGVLRLEDIKRRGGKPLLAGQSTSLWDIGDGIVCFEFHSKMNSLDPSVLNVLNDSIKFVAGSKGKYKGMVIYNDAPNFSVGANLAFAKALGKIGTGPVEDLIYYGQRVYQALRYAPFPVVGAPNGMALGGGCEILLHCDAIQASSESYMGLVESGVGIIPGWGGCARYLERAESAPGMKKGPFPAVKTAFQALLMPQSALSTSGQDAKNKLWLRPGDGVSMNRDRLLADAKAKAVSMAPGYAPPKPTTYRQPGNPAFSSLRMAMDDFYKRGDATWHDIAVADALADTLTGGDTHIGKEITEAQFLQRERENFMSLISMKQTQKRIDHTLATGKPLREEPLKEAKTLAEIRENRKSITLPARSYDGKPLSGRDALKLRTMAGAVWLMYKFVR